MIQLIQIVGALLIILSTFNLLFDDETKSSDYKKIFYKIGTGAIILLLGVALKHFGVDF